MRGVGDRIKKINDPAGRKDMMVLVIVLMRSVKYGKSGNRKQ